MQHLSANLRRSRGARGMSQQLVANAAGLSLSAYRKIEQGKVEPRVKSLQAIASGLGLPLRELLAPAPTLEKVRFRSTKKLKLREHLLVEVARRLEDYAELESILGQRLEPALVANKLRGKHRAERAAAAVREHFGLRPDEPVRDLCGLLESRGIKVLTLEVESDGFFGLSVAQEKLGPAVVVNIRRSVSVERWIFTAAHELGHLVLHASDYRNPHQSAPTASNDGTPSVPPYEEDPDHEREANEFAGAFLMPEEIFRREWHQACGMPLVDRVLKVKRMFGVSYRTVLYRASQDVPDPGRVFQRFHFEYKRLYGGSLKNHREPNALGQEFWRAGAPPINEGRPKQSRYAFIPERLDCLVRQGVEAEEISLSRGAEILGLSLLEMRERANSWVV